MPDPTPEVVPVAPEGITPSPMDNPNPNPETPPADAVKVYAEDYVKALRKEAQENRTKRQEAEAKLQALELEKMTESERVVFERDQLKDEIEAIRSKASLADQLAITQNAAIDEEIKGWHGDVKALDPGKDNILARMKWLPLARKTQKAYEIASQNGPDDLGLRNTNPNSATFYDKIRKDAEAQRSKSNATNIPLEQRLGRAPSTS